MDTQPPQENSAPASPLAETSRETPRSPDSMPPGLLPPVIGTAQSPNPIIVSSRLEKETKRIASPGAVLAGALLLGAAAETLFYGGSDVGIGFPLWIASFILILLVIAKREDVWVQRKNAIPLIAGLLFFSSAVAVRANGFILFLNLCTTLMLGAFLVRLLTTGALERVKGSEFIVAPLITLFHLLASAAPVVQKFNESLPGRPERKARVLPIVRGLLIATPVLCVFIALLASADEVFSRLVQHIATWLLPTDLGDRIARISMTLAVAWGSAGLLITSVKGWLRDDNKPDQSTGMQDSGKPLGFTEGAIILGSVIAVFAVFIAIQFVYLFGNTSHVFAVHNLNYATYARRGFNELVWVAVLTCALLLGLNGFLRRETGFQRRIFQIGGTTLITLTFCMLASAMKRMSAFEVAWGITELRLYVDAFIGWLGVALFALAARLWMRQDRGPTFAFCALLCAAGFVATLDIENVDALKINSNLRLSLQRGNFGPDISLFLATEDAIPQILPLANDPRLPAQHRAIIRENLMQHLGRLEKYEKNRSWAEWNYASDRAYNLLKAHRSEFEIKQQAKPISQYTTSTGNTGSAGYRY